MTLDFGTDIPGLIKVKNSLIRISIKFILEFAGANLVGEGASIPGLIKVKNSLIRISIKFIKNLNIFTQDISLKV